MRAIVTRLPLCLPVRHHLCLLACLSSPIAHTSKESHTYAVILVSYAIPLCTAFLYLPPPTSYQPHRLLPSLWDTEAIRPPQRKPLACFFCHIPSTYSSVFKPNNGILSNCGPHLHLYTLHTQPYFPAEMRGVPMLKWLGWREFNKGAGEGMSLHWVHWGDSDGLRQLSWALSFLGAKEIGSLALHHLMLCRK